ncbi:MAG: hypothetical protein JST01_23695 [Cyanobacteria bacterium SZAS TMP-1]|nr:hypothetical protein [Cyanobacteria bacterium SZAS TMP-1]
MTDVQVQDTSEKQGLGTEQGDAAAQASLNLSLESQAAQNNTIVTDAVTWLEKHRDDMWLVVSGASYHLKQENHPNQKNWGLGLEIKLDSDRSIVLGQYRNSINNESHYGGITYLPWHFGPVSAGGMFGIIDGYRPLHGKPIPIVMPFATIENKNFGVNIMAMPPIGDLSAVIGAQLKFKF